MKINTSNFKLSASLFSFEFFFTLFIFVGRFKGDPRLEWIPIDLTLFFFLICIVSAGYILFKRGFLLSKNKYYIVLCFLIFVIYMSLSMIWSPSILYAREKFFYFVSLTLFSFLSPWFIVSPDKKRVERFFFWVLFFGIFMLLETVLEISRGEVGFVNILGGNYLGVGRVIGIISMMVFIIFLLKNKSYKETFFYFFLLIVSWFAMLSIGARGPLISVIVIIPLISILLFNVKKSGVYASKKFILFASIVILITASFIYLLFSTEKIQTIVRLLVLFDDDGGDSAGTRLTHYMNGINFWLEKPILGHGIGAWPILNDGMDARSYPHNIFIESIVELGAIGTTLLLLFLFSLLFPSRALIKNLKADYLSVMIYFLALYSLVNAMFSGDFNDNRYLFVFLGLFNYILISHKLDFNYEKSSNH